jgi:sortase A
MLTEAHAVETAEPPESPPMAPSAPPRGPHPAATPNSLVRRIGATLSLASLLVLGFVVYLYGVSGVSESRTQSTLYKTLAGELGAATAPVGPTDDGAPVAILNSPRLGISDLVVVEGTTSRDLTRGPGHVRASVLPGQAGVSVLYGKAATFGAPFAHLMRLNRGDRITVITGQGTATYVVASFGNSAHAAPDQTANRLVLMTADSNLVPTATVQVTADLVSAPQASPGGRPAVIAQDHLLATDLDSLIPLVMWSQALLLASIGATVAAQRWSRWPAYLCAAPVVLALTLSVYENLAAMLPNVY